MVLGKLLSSVCNLTAASGLYMMPSLVKHGEPLLLNGSVIQSHPIFLESSDASTKWIHLEHMGCVVLFCFVFELIWGTFGEA